MDRPAQLLMLSQATCATFHTIADDRTLPTRLAEAASALGRGAKGVHNMDAFDNKVTFFSRARSVPLCL